MKKYIHLFIFFVLFLSIKKVSAQTWESVGSGIDGISSSMTEFDGKMYVAYGQYTSPHSFLTCWNGTAWTPITILNNDDANITGQISKILDMVEYQGELYVAGDFDTIGGVAAHCIAKYDGTAWSAVGNVSFQGTECCTPQVYRLAIYNGELYATGTFDSINGIACKSIARWDGTEWRTLNATFNTSVIVQGVCVYNEALYAGIMYLNTGVAEIIKYNGTSMETIGVLNAGGSPSVFSVFNEKMYFGGYFSSINNVQNMHNFAVWNGSTWSSFGDGPVATTTTGDIDGSIMTLTVKDNSLYIGGYFKYLNDVCVNNIARYDGFSISSLGTGVSGEYTGVYCTNLYNNTLYVAGNFDTISNVIVENIAVLTDEGILTSVSGGILSDTVAIYSNLFIEEYTICFSDNEQHTVQIVDAFGKIVAETQGIGKISFSRNDIASGIYVVRIMDAHGKVTMRKIIAT